MALVTTPASASADSYATIAFADVYLDRLADGNWAAKSDPNKEKLLKQSTQDLDRWLRQHATDEVLIGQALSWPWMGEEIQTSAEDGSTTTAIIAAVLQLAAYPDDHFNSGSLFIQDTADDAAPEFELNAISDFVRSTGTLTTAAFTATVDSGDGIWIFPPVPTWLQQAVCEQAMFLNEDDQSRSGNDIQAGISQRSSQGGNITYKPHAQAQWLSAAAANLVLPYLPREPGVSRG